MDAERRVLGRLLGDFLRRVAVFPKGCVHVIFEAAAHCARQISERGGRGVGALRSELSAHLLGQKKELSMHLQHALAVNNACADF